MQAHVIAATLAVAVSWLSTQAFAQGKYSDWGPPVNLGCGINSPYSDFGPAISKDGLSLYFSSNRGNPSSNASEIYVAQRASRDGQWGTPRSLGPIIGAGNNPSFSRDEHWMFFNSARAGSIGDTDVWASYRKNIHDDFAWQMPINLGPGVNTTAFEAGASYFANEDGVAPLLFFGRGVSATTQASTTDIWVAELLPDGTFGNPHAITELNSAQGDQRPSIRFDGLEIFFFSTREGSTLGPDGKTVSSDIWVATRSDVEDLWNDPVNLGTGVNSSAPEIQPYISGDGLTLLFASTRADGCGGSDVYMTTRTHGERGE